jgi:hypothetical protein
MPKILVRKDDPEQRIELIRGHATLRGWFGYTRTMLANRRATALFPNCTWKEISKSGGTN